MGNRYIALIPAYEPEEKLISLARDLRGRGFDIVIVDDGSGMRKLRRSFPCSRIRNLQEMQACACRGFLLSFYHICVCEHSLQASVEETRRNMVAFQILQVCAPLKA